MTSCVIPSLDNCLLNDTLYSNMWVKRHFVSSLSHLICQSFISLSQKSFIRLLGIPKSFFLDKLVLLFRWLVILIIIVSFFEGFPPQDADSSSSHPKHLLLDFDHYWYLVVMIRVLCGFDSCMTINFYLSAFVLKSFQTSQRLIHCSYLRVEYGTVILQVRQSSVQYTFLKYYYVGWTYSISYLGVSRVYGDFSIYKNVFFQSSLDAPNFNRISPDL